jgi:hypothetical protein
LAVVAAVFAVVVDVVVVDAANEKKAIDDTDCLSLH